MFFHLQLTGWQQLPNCLTTYRSDSRTETLFIFIIYVCTGLVSFVDLLVEQQRLWWRRPEIKPLWSVISDTSVSLNKQKLEVSPRYLWLRWAKLGYADLFPPFGQRGARVSPCHVTTGWFGQNACAFVLLSSSLSLHSGVFREGRWWQPPAFWGQIRSISPSGCYIVDAMTIST